MRGLLLAEVARLGLITRRQALALVPVHVLEDAIIDGCLTRNFPSIYTLPERQTDRDIRRRGAIAYRPRAVLSAIDALDVWGVYPFRIPPREPIHLTTDRRESYAACSGITLRRRSTFQRTAPYAWEFRGLPVVCIEQALVDSWTLLPDRDRRVPVMVAVRERRTKGPLLIDALARNRRVAGAAEMRRVFGLVAAGCHSPLELWGHEKVFSHPGLPVSACQVRI